MITKRQKEVLDFVEFYEVEMGYLPSLETIKGHLNISSVSTAHYHITKLKKAGYLAQDGHSVRSISKHQDLISNSCFKEQAISIPIFGMANAGEATFLATESIDGYIKIPNGMRIDKDDVFALRVVGDSMNQADVNGKKIEDGDYVLIDSNTIIPNNGDYVLAIIDDYANIKKYERNIESGEIRLLSESSNSSHKPIYVSSEDKFMVNGKIIAVIKK